MSGKLRKSNGRGKNVFFLTLTSQNGWFSDRSVKGKKLLKIGTFHTNRKQLVRYFLSECRTQVTALTVLGCLWWFFGLFSKMLIGISPHTSGITLLGIPKERGRISLCSVISIPSPASASESAYLHPLYWIHVVVELKRINFTDSNPPGYL